jgi:sialate O-acetylesterase
MSKMYGKLFLAAILISVGFILSEKCFSVELAPLFTDDMVLQRSVKIPIWGQGTPKEKVSVTFHKQQKDTVVDEAGYWRVDLEPEKAGGPFDLTVKGSETIKLSNILVGEVWLCSGQSNMQMSLRSVQNASEEIKTADYPEIRVFTVPQKITNPPEANVKWKKRYWRWKVCTPKSAPGFSGVAFLFGRTLYQKLKVPVGLICSASGGTPIEAWMDNKVLKANPEENVSIQKKWLEIEQNWDQKKADETWEKVIQDWTKAVQKAKAEGVKPPGKPYFNHNKYATPKLRKHYPANLYNCMIRPLIPYAIKGIVWYQGEANDKEPDLYRKLFPEMIKDLRQKWGDNTLPFIFVQLPSYGQDPGKAVQKGGVPLPEFREAQCSAMLELKNVGMAVAMDVQGYHPRDKQTISSRLAAWALAQVYHLKEYGNSISPTFKSMTVKDGKALIEFNNTGSGLVSKDGEALKYFAIAGKDMKFYKANTELDKNSVLVWSDKVPEPVAVRYAWGGRISACNLFNKEGFPAASFRTDKWSDRQISIGE